MIALRLLEGGPALIQRAPDAAQTLTVEVGSEQSRERIAITSGTVALYDQAGVALLSPSAITPSTSTPGRATYSLSASVVPATLALGKGYRLRWVLEVDSRSYTIDQDATLCRLVPPMSITAEDLYALHPELRGQVPPSQAAAGVGWAPQIDAAWREITQLLYDRGRRHELVWSRGSLRRCHLALTLSRIYGGAVTGIGGAGTVYADLQARYRDEYQRAWDELVFDYDPDDLGLRGATQAGESVIIAHAGPRRSWARGWGGW